MGRAQFHLSGLPTSPGPIHLDSLCSVCFSSGHVAEVSRVKLGNLSFRHVALGIFVLALLNWAFLQFVVLPNMSVQECGGMYAGWISAPYPYAISVLIIFAFIWFAFFYRGRHSTHGRRIAAFGMALGGLCGMAMILVIRLTWHI
jgi:hypothetical protein